MIPFRVKQPANKINPYLNMLEDIRNEIELFGTVTQSIPTSIIINTDDYPHLVKACQDTGLFPKNRDDLKVFQSARIFRSPDMPKGSFRVVGN